MYKKAFTVIALFALLTLVLAACGVRDTAAGAANNGPTVKMSSAAFEVSQITIKKGQALTLVDDVAVPHVIKNGIWKNNNPQVSQEQGAPTVDLNFNGVQGESATTPPFTTAGTYHLLCTIHPNMQLTVIVQ
jgi:plastocyanin